MGDGGWAGEDTGPYGWGLTGVRWVSVGRAHGVRPYMGLAGKGAVLGFRGGILNFLVLPQRGRFSFFMISSSRWRIWRFWAPSSTWS